MSNRLFQGVVNQMFEVIGQTIGVIDQNNIVIACSDSTKVGKTHDIEAITVASGNEPFVGGHFTYMRFGSVGEDIFTVFVDGIDDDSAKYAKMLSVSFKNIKLYYDEKYDRQNFIKNVLLNNIFQGDIYLKARELHFSNDETRVVLLVRLLSKNDVSVYDIIGNLFPDKTKDFNINISDTDIAIVKQVEPGTDSPTLENLARSIVDTLATEFYIHAVCGIGTVVKTLKDLALSFRDAQLALEVGKVFDTEKSIISYDNLGIARLIYQLPTTLCETFLAEVFKKGSLDSLDQETLYTIQKFFENNLNVSETSRKLFLHRNTLVYRLEKIKKITGLDLREFDHAIIYKIALMVQKYLKSNPTKF